MLNLRSQVARAALLAFGTLGCELVTKDETTLTIPLPVVTYSIDTDGRNIGFPETVPEVACVEDSDCCLDGPCRQNGYTLRCHESRCQAEAVATLVAPIDFAVDETVARARSVSAIKLKTLTFQVCDNTLSTTLDGVELFAAPPTLAHTSTKGSARAIGVLPPIAARRNQGCVEALSATGRPAWAAATVLAGAESAFSEVATDGTQVNAIAVAPIVMRAGEGAPSGSLLLRIGGTVEVTVTE